MGHHRILFLTNESMTSAQVKQRALVAGMVVLEQSIQVCVLYMIDRNEQTRFVQHIPLLYSIDL